MVDIEPALRELEKRAVLKDILQHPSARLGLQTAGGVLAAKFIYDLVRRRHRDEEKPGLMERGAQAASLGVLVGGSHALYKSITKPGDYASTLHHWLSEADTAGDTPSSVVQASNARVAQRVGAAA